MILVDANILLYAEDQLSSQHEQALSWWDSVLGGSDPVCLCWPVITAFVRLSTNHRVFRHPLSIDQAIQRVASWLEQRCVQIIAPGPGHWKVFADMLRAGQAMANLVNDAHLAALAIEHGCELYSCDADFARFPKLKFHNPLR